MDIVEKSRIFGCIFLLVVVGIAVAAMFWFSELMQKESNNRYLLREMAAWSVDEMRLHPDYTLQDVPAATRGRINRSRAYRKLIQGDEVLDIWGNEIRFSILPNGEEFEWRSAGKDGKFDTEDDRYSRGKKGAITVSPI